VREEHKAHLVCLEREENLACQDLTVHLVLLEQMDRKDMLGLLA